MPSKSKIGDLINKLGIDETYTKPTKKPKQFTHVKDNIPLVENYNFMADLLFLPETKEGFKYCLVVVDLSNDDFDIEPIKNKTPAEILKAMKDMFKRKFIKEPYASIQTDAGGGDPEGAPTRPPDSSDTGPAQRRRGPGHGRERRHHGARRGDELRRRA